MGLKTIMAIMTMIRVLIMTVVMTVNEGNYRQFGGHSHIFGRADGAV